MRRRLRGRACAVLVAMLWGAAASAEPPGRLAGRVTDGTSAALPGASVEAKPAGGGEAKTATTDGDGRYRLEALAPGAWDVSFHLPNFAQSVVRGVVIRAGEQRSLDATLHLRMTAQVLVTAPLTFRDLSTVRSDEELIGIAAAASSGVVAGADLGDRPLARPGDLVERVPGVIISQHSGEGKANQYYVRGFNIDHGTDLALHVAGLPVNMPTHGHGQGYADLNFVIPELVGGIQFQKGTYDAREGDFSAAGSLSMSYLNVLERPLAKLELGEYGYRRLLVAASPRLGEGHLLAALELGANDGPWTLPDDFRKLNGVIRYSRGSGQSGFSLTGLFYDAEWNSTDQVPRRAVADGRLSRFGHVDASDGGRSHRHSLVAAWQRGAPRSLTRVEGYVSRYGMNLFSNFSYFLGDPENGDQFEQRDDRWLAGFRANRTWVLGSGLRQTELTAGLQARHDDIAPVGLYLTRARERLATTREDQVRQSSGAGYVQADTWWNDTVRTVVGLRGDLYAFDVDSLDPANSGSDTAGRLSPKLSLALGPFDRTELYLNYGWGFHSNDARGATITRDPASGEPADPVDPLVRARGAELGLRSLALPGVQLTAALWGLDIDSELLFVGDAGTTEASRPSRRRGVELAADWSPQPWLKLDGSWAWTHARFTDDDPAGDRIPGAIEGVFAAGAAFHERSRLSGSLRVRWFGPRPLIEDDSVRSESSTLVNADLVYHLRPGWAIQLSAFNLLDAEVSDVDYFYASRLPGEPLEGIEDIHTHPTPPRTFRIGLVATF
ncbi:MAG: TonB-dependent receptor [Vicinamibacteria bacterium]|nr:TonB-dependent receptor [Vicinamibacteria bacterium]